MRPLPVDVMVCCRNDGALVPGVLGSLRAQSVGTASFRVIFVDNGSTDDTRTMVERHRGNLQLEYIYEARAGHNRARNTGYTVARASYVAHLDADAKAETTWLENIVRVIAEHDPDLCGGPYFPYYVSRKPSWYLDRYQSLYLGPLARELGPHEFLSGSNMVWRRQVVETLGGFRSDIGLVGRGLARGDETNLMVRARRRIAGFKVVYDPDTVVHALVRDECFSMVYWLRRSFQDGSMHSQVRETDDTGRSKARAAARLIAGIVRTSIEAGKGFGWRDRKRYPAWQNYWYERVVPETYAIGVAWRTATWHGRISKESE